MYNGEIKQRFIDDFSAQNNGKYKYEWVLQQFERYEAGLGKDVGMLSKDEAVWLVQGLCISDIGSLQGVCSVGKSYVKWCKDNGLFTGSDYGFLKLRTDDIDMTETLRRVLFKDEKELLSSITLVHSLDDGYVDVPALVLAWLGIPKELFVVLRDDNVDLQNRIITAPDGEVLVSGFSDVIHDALRRFVDCRISTRENGRFEMKVVKDYSTSAFLKKMVSQNSEKFGTEYTLNQIISQIGKLSLKYEAKGFPHRHSYTNAFRSGRFYELWELEQSGVDVLDPKNRAEVERVFRSKKNYYNAIKMYRFYRQAFWSDIS